MLLFLRHLIAKFKEQHPKVLLPPADLEYVAEELRIFHENIKQATHFLQHESRGAGVFTTAPPLFLVIGASSAGKSTLLSQSNLGLIDTNRQEFSNPASTRYCNFWFSQKEIFVDTAGHYTSAAPSDAATNLAWRGLLKLMHRYQMHFPLSGVIIAIDLPALARDPGFLSQMLTNVKQRLYEIAKYAHNIPIFLVFTKSDLILGFKEFFADLSSEARQQRFGISFQNNRSLRPIQVFNSKFSILVKHLNEFALNRLQQESNLLRRELIKDFPLQIESLGKTIHAIINEVPHSGYTYLSEVCFTSSLQEGKPHDCLFTVNNKDTKKDVAKKGRIRGVYATNKQQSYFVAELFQHLIKLAHKRQPKNRAFYAKDNKLKSKRVFKLPARQKPLKILAYGLVVLCFIGGIILGYHYNNLHLSRSFQELQRQYWALNKEKDASNKLLRTYEVLQKNHVLQNSYRWRLVGESNLHKQFSSDLELSYSNALNSVFVPQLQSALAKELDNGNMDDSVATYSALKVYLMLGDNSKMDVGYVRNWFINYWANVAKLEPTAINQNIRYLEDFFVKKIKIAIDDALVSSVRANFSKLPPEKILYAIFNDHSSLSAKQDHLLIDADRKSIFNTDSFVVSSLYEHQEIRDISQDLAVFLKDTKLRDWVMDLDEPDWVSKVVSDEKVKKSILDLYFSTYAKVWKDALGKVEIKEFGSLQGVGSDLKGLTLANGALLTLVQKVKENTGSLDNTNIFKNWQDLDVKKLSGLINALSQFADKIATSSNVQEAAWVNAKNIIQDEKFPAVIEDINNFAKDAPEPLRTWLHAIVDNYWKLLLQNSHIYINNVWNSNVLPKFAANLLNRYPLYKDASSDAQLEDFNAFFAPKGTLDNFFTSYLKPFVDVSKDYWVWKEFANQKLDIPQSTLEMFIRGYLIEKMFFADAAMTPDIHFSLTPTSLDAKTKSFTLLVDGQVVFATNSKMKEQELKWPGPEVGNVAIQFVDQQGQNTQVSFTGQWAWFKLLDHSDVQTTSDVHRYEVTFSNEGSSAKFNLVASKAANPFIPDIVNNFRCVDKL
ncbi:MAG: type VI secretion protein IcmF/TssM N-terminal domain-containing protein [Gammaproteobacteria bacterium]